MTVFRHNCSANGCYLQRRWDPNSLGQAYNDHTGEWPFTYGQGRRCSPTDIDSLLERNGHLLFIESKTAGAKPNKGQEIALQTLTRHGATVLVQELNPPSEDAVVRFEVWWPGGAKKRYEPATRLERDEWVAKWWRAASTGQLKAA